jgi:hypothetical protein
MYSKRYYEIVESVKKFHLENKTYSGGGTLGYAHDIKELAEKYNPKSLLDYGCGKGLQYESGSIIAFGNDQLTFDKFIGVESVYKFDPCVEKFKEHPPTGAKFDAIIAIQSLTAIPDADMPLIVKQLESMTNKFCFIGTNLKTGKTKKGNGLENKDPYFLGNRLDPKWWKEQFKDWKGSELVLKFIDG